MSSHCFSRHPPPKAGVVSDEMHGWGRKEGLDIIRARANSASNATGRRSTGNWESHLWSLCFSLHPGKRSPAGLDNLASRQWLPAGVATGRGWGQRREMGGGNRERGQGPSPTPSLLGAPGHPHRVPALMGFGNNVIPSACPSSPRGWSGLTEGASPGASPSCPYRCKEFFPVTSLFSHWGEPHFWPQP